MRATSKLFSTVMALSLAFSVTAAQAVMVEDVELPDQVEVGGKTLKLNGAGMREATMLKVDVYAGGLYLSQPSQSAEEIINSTGSKQVILKFAREVSAKQMQEAWKEGVPKNCKSGCDGIQAELDQLVANSVGAKKGESYVYEFTSSGMKLKRPDGQSVSFKNPDFIKAVLGTWIGEHPATKDLRKGMLGQNK